MAKRTVRMGGGGEIISGRPQRSIAKQGNVRLSLKFPLLNGKKRGLLGRLLAFKLVFFRLPTAVSVWG
jgi:hypothetical protein